MKITKIESYLVELDWEGDWAIDERHYKKGPILRNVVVQIETDEGVTGIGEGAHFPGLYGEHPEGSIAAIKLYTPELLGKDPFNIVQMHQIMDKCTPIDNNAAKGAVDIAVYDIMGKWLQVPVYKLLGGKTREKFKTQFCIPTKEPGQMVDLVTDLMGKGFSIFKVKLSGQITNDLERMIALLDASKEGITFSMDPNQGWTVKETMRIANHIVHHDKYCDNVILEQPVSRHDIDGLAWITRSTPLRVLVDDVAQTPEDVLKIVQKRVGDIISIKIWKAGGIYKALQNIAIAEAANYPYIIDEAAGSRVANTADAHLALVAKDMVYGGCTCWMYCSPDVVEEGGVKVSQGEGMVSESPGLGITKLRDIGTGWQTSL